jgi:hypothetical protein
VLAEPEARCRTVSWHRNAASGEDLIDVAQAERVAEMEPHGEPDDLGWEAVAGIAGRSRRCHPVRLRGPDCAGKPDGQNFSMRLRPIKLTVPLRELRLRS